MKRRFKDLSAQEVLALAIIAEEEDARLYQEYARLLRPNYPSAAADLDRMRAEEDNHRARLLQLYQDKFSGEIPLIQRRDVKGFFDRKTLLPLGPDLPARVRRQVYAMELQAQRFYMRAASQTADPELRQLLSNLAAEERKHEKTSAQLTPEKQTLSESEEELRIARELFVLQVIQPGLAGLMDGSVSTLAPIFAAAFATHLSWPTFLVGVAASVGAGISMGFAEALSDDGSLTGRGHPALRGVICGIMTFLGGVFHTLPFLIPHFGAATAVATLIVLVELFVIAWIRNKYMDTLFSTAVVQVVVGGVLVFLCGILIGSA